MLFQIKNLKAGYGELEVLRDISIQVNQGEIVALIGPNGAGKSTVLKSVMGLTTKTGGKIHFKEHDITSMPTHELLRAGIGFVPQGRLVFSTMTVRENLEMGAYLVTSNPSTSLRASERQPRRLRVGAPTGASEVTRLEKVFSYFPVLKKKAKEKAGALSGGEQQMLAVGRALMMTPELLMLDEPSLGLSPKATSDMFEKLKEINAVGTTLLIVEQNVRQVLKYATRGYLLAAGAVRHHGTAHELGSERLMEEAYLL